MLVLESLVARLIQISIVDLVGLHTRQRCRNLGQLTAQVLALLVCALRGSRQGSELRVDLMQELREFAKLKRTGLVLVVLLEELVKAAEVVRGLRETLADAGCYFAPFAEGQVQLLGVLALLPGDGAQEGHDVAGEIVLDGRAVANCVDIAEGRADETKVGVCFEGMLVVLGFKLVGEALAEIGAGWLGV